ncbi:GIY-YIG nuclease family protein [Halobellus ruber]|uniref:GIY-YIG nuclease family protein n=1 Tax=Halobellus ruber TaxID=2761102 RepID=A0A7J9SF70_9EURY|nr:GIY-YIG nuclease family protein [Halobellus ruber]MBB6645614.1 GIY-YIG nuclease family protein [Halobellus ruber]
MPTESAGEAAVVLDPDDIADGSDPLGVGAGDAPPGTYVLVFRVDTPARIDVGALGGVEFPAGAYAYVGSAFGSGGLGRVDRHRRVAAGSHAVRHWHIDYLGSHPESSLDSVVAAPEADVECHLSRQLRSTVGADSGDAPTPGSGFGASDCDCPAHLIAGADAEGLRAAAVDAVASVTEGEP